MVFRMFSRRNRGFLGTCFVLISIVCFGYGLYMYDLKSVKLSESQAMLHRTERSAAQLDKKVEKLRSEKKSLEEQLGNVSTSNMHFIRKMPMEEARFWYGFIISFSGKS